MIARARVAVSISARLAAAVIVVVLASALQTTDLATLGSVKANLPLAALSAFAFIVPTFTWYLAFILIAGFFVRFAPGFDLTLVVFVAVVLLGYAASRLLSSVATLGAPLIAGASTFLFYLIIDFAFVRGHLLTVSAEACANAIVAAVCYFVVLFFEYE